MRRKKLDRSNQRSSSIGNDVGELCLVQVLCRSLNGILKSFWSSPEHLYWLMYLNTILTCMCAADLDRFAECAHWGVRKFVGQIPCDEASSLVSEGNICSDRAMCVEQQWEHVLRDAVDVPCNECLPMKRKKIILSERFSHTPHLRMKMSMELIVAAATDLSTVMKTVMQRSKWSYFALGMYTDGHVVASSAEILSSTR